MISHLKYRFSLRKILKKGKNKLNTGTWNDLLEYMQLACEFVCVCVFIAEKEKKTKNYFL